MADSWHAVAALVDRSRRALYDYVRRQDHPVGREEAADATRMSRGLVAFHLDKLVEAGLLTARYATADGAPRRRGRTPKVYEALGDGVTVTIPERHYELIAEILADAVAEAPTRAQEAALLVAHQRGVELGRELRPTDVVEALAGLGFEPTHELTGVVLRNCPFHVLAARQTALVCGLNHSFVNGLLEGMGASGLDGRLAPRPDACCVEITGGQPESGPGGG